MMNLSNIQSIYKLHESAAPQKPIQEAFISLMRSNKAGIGKNNIQNQAVVKVLQYKAQQFLTPSNLEEKSRLIGNLFDVLLDYGFNTAQLQLALKLIFSEANSAVIATLSSQRCWGLIVLIVTVLKKNALASCNSQILLTLKHLAKVENVFSDTPEAAVSNYIHGLSSLYWEGDLAVEDCKRLVDILINDVLMNESLPISVRGELEASLDSFIQSDPQFFTALELQALKQDLAKISTTLPPYNNH